MKLWSNIDSSDRIDYETFYRRVMDEKANRRANKVLYDSYQGVLISFVSMIFSIAFKSNYE